MTESPVTPVRDLNGKIIAWSRVNGGKTGGPSEGTGVFLPCRVFAQFANSARHRARSRW